MKYLTFFSTIALSLGLWLSLSAQDRWPEPPFSPDALQVLGDLEEERAAVLERELFKIWTEAEALYEKLEVDSDMSGSQREETLHTLQEKMREYEKHLQEGLTDEQYAVAVNWGERPLAYAFHLVETVPGLSEKKRSTLRALHDTLLKLEEKKLSPERAESLETRYWFLVAVMLETEQWASLRHRLPREFKGQVSWEDLLLLPGMSGAQMNQIRAEYQAAEAETIATRAEIARLERSSENEDQDSMEILDPKLLALYEQVEQRERALEHTIRTLLTPEQRQSLESYPPGISLLELYENLEFALDGIPWTPQQKKRLEERAVELEEQYESVFPKLESMESRLESDPPEASGDFTLEVEQLQLMLPLWQAQLSLAREAVSTAGRSQLRNFLERSPQADSKPDEDDE